MNNKDLEISDRRKQCCSNEKSWKSFASSSLSLLLLQMNITSTLPLLLQERGDPEDDDGTINGSAELTQEINVDIHYPKGRLDIKLY